MKIKICGMKNAENVREIASLHPDYMGFIFYSPSPRNALGLSYTIVTKLPKTIKKTGVFVDATKAEIEEYVNIHHLDAVQLHGNESVELCRFLNRNAIEVIKTVKVPEEEEEDFFKKLEYYKDYVDLFLFEPEGKEAGGNGKKFNWEILNKYPLDIPYLLSGGISPEDVSALKAGLPPKCIGVDLNSKFEIEPGVKDVSKLSSFIKEMRNEPTD